MKVQLGRSPEDLEREKAEKQRKIEAEIQQRNAERIQRAKDEAERVDKALQKKNEPSKCEERTT